jgi:predicted RNA binding protein YcfA (HicA-like mRNA interferase family)
MSKIEKLIGRLQSRPKDFTWEEIKKVLKHYGYEEVPKGKTGGSRRKFMNEDNVIISLHEPHPKNILKSYQLETIIQHLGL